jgi:acetylornithine deacetylase/succinyl-diaminopimelate desuccinylase-like protein
MPSSADAAYSQDVIETSESKAKVLKSCDFVEIWNILTYGEKIIDKDLPTVVYGHYDVQPADPMELGLLPIWACD